MRFPSFTWLPYGVVLISSIGFLSAASGQDIETTTAALDGGIEQWRSGVEFACHYTYRQGCATSKDLALQGEYGSRVNLPEQEDLVTGVFCKRGDWMRFSVNYGKPPIGSSNNGFTTLANLSFDNVSVGDLWLSYIPGFGVENGIVRISKRPESTTTAFEAGPEGLQSLLNPFSFGGGSELPLSTFAPREGFDETVVRTVNKTDSEHLAVEMVRTGTNGSKETRQVVFWTRYSPPVIEAIESHIEEHGKPTVILYEIGSDFISCGKGMMAKRLRAIAGPVTPLEKKEPVWIAKEWYSEDLGQAMPTEKDFVVTISPDVRVQGLRAPPGRGAVRTFDLAKYTPDDLVRPNEIVLAAAPAKPVTVSRSGSRLFWVGLSAAAFLVLLSLVAVWARQARRKPLL